MQPYEYMTADDVVKYFGRTPEMYVGTANSDFQSHPITYGSDGNPTIVSDWDMHVLSEVKAGREEPKDFPRFFDYTEQYIQRSQELGLNMFRLSLDFARLCPEPEVFNEGLMTQYVKALALIKAHDQEPMLCIYHWPMPNYLLDMDNKGRVRAGGWEHPEVQKHFQFYVENVVHYLSDEKKVRAALIETGFNEESQDKLIDEGLVKYFLTINEPTSILTSGYLVGTFPPYKKADALAFRKVLSQLMIAHKNVQEELESLGKTQTGSPQVGISHNWALYEGPLGSGRLADALGNRLVTNLMEGNSKTHFLGLQHYSRMKLPLTHGKSGRRLYGEDPDFGDMYPPGMYQVLQEMTKQYPEKPIIITEFGFSDKSDLLRPYWLIETARYIMQAKQEGLPVKGMLLWTLVNNFEWARGMRQKFGLFNEGELAQPLIPSESDSIRSWEVWQAIANVLSSQDEETLKPNLQELQRVYGKAEEQFQHTLEKRSQR